MWYITSFYFFSPLKDLEKHKLIWQWKMEEWNGVGLVILGEEGLNATTAFPSQELKLNFQNWVKITYPQTTPFFKDSQAHRSPFKKFVMKIKPEIVTLGRPDLKPISKNNHHLTPTQWHETLKRAEFDHLIDTRNWYEYQLGHFRGAINPNIDSFTQFFEWFERQKFRKDSKVLIYCTGGIRCEKGIYALQEKGYQNVYQLEGGIINYLAHYPNQEFLGDCFVFDDRIAVNQNLEPCSQYEFCRICGQPRERSQFSHEADLTQSQKVLSPQKPKVLCACESSEKQKIVGSGQESFLSSDTYKSR